MEFIYKAGAGLPVPKCESSETQLLTGFVLIQFISAKQLVLEKEKTYFIIVFCGNFLCFRFY